MLTHVGQKERSSARLVGQRSFPLFYLCCTHGHPPRLAHVALPGYCLCCCCGIKELMINTRPFAYSLTLGHTPHSHSLGTCMYVYVSIIKPSKTIEKLIPIELNSTPSIHIEGGRWWVVYRQQNRSSLLMVYRKLIPYRFRLQKNSPWMGLGERIKRMADPPTNNTRITWKCPS